VRVYDNAGNYLDSSATAVTVDNTAPNTATITSPSAGADVGGTISVDANAADNAGGSGVDYVEFWLDSIGGTLIGSDSTSLIRSQRPLRPPVPGRMLAVRFRSMRTPRIMQVVVA